MHIMLISHAADVIKSHIETVTIASLLIKIIEALICAIRIANKHYQVLGLVVATFSITISPTNIKPLVSISRFFLFRFPCFSNFRYF